MHSSIKVNDTCTTLEIGPNTWLKLQHVYDVVHTLQKVALTLESKQAMEKSREVLQDFVDNRLPVYGVSTQFGGDANCVQINGDEEQYLASMLNRQHNLIMALSCGVGELCSDEIVRATLLLRAQANAQGVSAIRVEVVEYILALLNNNCLPLMHRYGSVGSSGDLIPLASIALGIMGKQNLKKDNKILPAKEVLTQIGLKPLVLQIKEGLSIVNGSSFSTAIASTAVHKLCYLLPLSIAVLAVCCEAMLAIDNAYHPFVHQSKHHLGQIKIADFILECWKESANVRSLKKLRNTWKEALGDTQGEKFEHVQDFYSLRCIAHGFGPFWENLKNAVKVIEEEINSANDNPIIDSQEREIFHGANFMTDYIAVTSDHLRADIAKASTWLHAILANLIHPRKSRGLPANLIDNPEQQSGFKAVQIMVASLAIHNRSRTLPVSSVMLPTEGDNQDMVSLGTHSAFDLLEVTENYGLIIAALLIASAQAIEIRGLQNAGNMAQKISNFVRKRCPFVKEDRPLSNEIKQIAMDLSNPEQCKELIEPWFLT